MNKPAFVFLTNQWPKDGGGGIGVASRFLRGVARHWPPSGRQACYAVLGDECFPVSEPRDIDDLLSIARPVPRLRTIKWVRQALQISALLEQHQTVVVLAFSPFFAGSILGHLRRRIRVLQTEHTTNGIHMEYLAEKGKRNLKFWAIRHAALQNLATSDMAVFPSQRAADLFLENNPQVRAALSGRARVAYSGIDDCLKTATVPQARVPPEVKGSLRIVSIGHHVPIKRIDVVLYALRSLLDKRPPVPAISFVNFGGETEHTRRLRELTAALGLEGTVQFRGLRPNSEVMAALVEADLFLVVPELAAFDLALLEAMAAAKPIITSRAGGNPEALGQAYPFYAETSEQVCASLERMIGGWQGAVAIGRQNRERFLRFFTIKAMVDRYWDLASEAADFPSRSGVAVGPR